MSGPVKFRFKVPGAAAAAAAAAAASQPAASLAGLPAPGWAPPALVPAGLSGANLKRERDDGDARAQPDVKRPMLQPASSTGSVQTGGIGAPSGGVKLKIKMGSLGSGSAAASRPAAPSGPALGMQQTQFGSLLAQIANGHPTPQAAQSYQNANPAGGFSSALAGMGLPPGFPVDLPPGFPASDKQHQRVAMQNQKATEKAQAKAVNQQAKVDAASTKAREKVEAQQRKEEAKKEAEAQQQLAAVMGQAFNKKIKINIKVKAPSLGVDAGAKPAPGPMATASRALQQPPVPMGLARLPSTSSGPPGSHKVTLKFKRPGAELSEAAVAPRRPGSMAALSRAAVPLRPLPSLRAPPHFMQQQQLQQQQAAVAPPLDFSLDSFHQFQDLADLQQMLDAPPQHMPLPQPLDSSHYPQYPERGATGQRPRPGAAPRHGGAAHRATPGSARRARDDEEYRPDRGSSYSRPGPGARAPRQYEPLESTQVPEGEMPSITIIMGKVLDGVGKKDASNGSIFKFPVTDAQAPNYSKLITTPMCLDMVGEKVARGAYATLEDFEADLGLIWSNAGKYNAPGTFVHHCSLFMSEVADKYLEEARKGNLNFKGVVSGLTRKYISLWNRQTPKQPAGRAISAAVVASPVITEGPPTMPSFATGTTARQQRGMMSAVSSVVKPRHSLALGGAGAGRGSRHAAGSSGLGLADRASGRTNKAQKAQNELIRRQRALDPDSKRLLATYVRRSEDEDLRSTFPLPTPSNVLCGHWRGLAAGASAEGAPFSAGPLLMRPQWPPVQVPCPTGPNAVHDGSGLQLDAYVRSLARFVARCPAAVRRQVVSSRLATCMVVEGGINPEPPPPTPRPTCTPVPAPTPTPVPTPMPASGLAEAEQAPRAATAGWPNGPSLANGPSAAVPPGMAAWQRTPHLQQQLPFTPAGGTPVMQLSFTPGPAGTPVLQNPAAGHVPGLSPQAYMTPQTFQFPITATPAGTPPSQLPPFGAPPSQLPSRSLSPAPTGPGMHLPGSTPTPTYALTPARTPSLNAVPNYALNSAATPSFSLAPAYAHTPAPAPSFAPGPALTLTPTFTTTPGLALGSVSAAGMQVDQTPAMPELPPASP